MPTTQRPHLAALLADDPALDTNVPNVARIYDYLLGGKDNWHADREAADALVRLLPDLRDAVRDNRAFLRRAVGAVAEQGINQFIDIGSGLPTRDNVHQVAQHVRPDARVMYVDHDSVVAAHARALLASDAVTGVLHADVRDIAFILDHPDVRALIDFERPIAVVMVALMHFLSEADDPAAIIDTLWQALPPGSVLIFTHACTDGLENDTVSAATRVYANSTAPITARSSREILALFGERWAWQEPGLIPVRDWRPEPDPIPVPPSKTSFVGGVAIPQCARARQAA
ncbi:SAM-dependent methyltransferase [Nonomuraea dietziae]|uniref:O-methyltransferase involved in polyketide biosynthesis n=1 Tax=Nonomuraea dietziae TaxID=65515 RepID=A0A7W5YD28_9ACTN|nr:SAM-dependent methyltransferase [Nonomuraea dietziae]MBB3733818.1 O-methyltransferase involved in polyketide biosynthesis [Nonomuraea dietziae]